MILSRNPINVLIALICAALPGFAQHKPQSAFLSRVGTTPAYVIRMFQDAGMSPKEHPLTKEEMKIVSDAFAVLPSRHQKVLMQHLKSISFLDNMPNTALTAPLTAGGEDKQYHIAFRAGILPQTISEWVTEKERTCYSSGDSSITVSIDAGKLSAFTYVLLHEGTHVLDGSTGLISTDTLAGKTKQNTFTQNFARGIWEDIFTHQQPLADSVLVKNHFRRGGRKFLPSEAAAVYKGLSKTSFVSLYSTASWHEDIAELLSVYHLTEVLKQPFSIRVSQKGKELFHYDPMQSPQVRQRLPILMSFYQT
ncbi:hypothetical protein OQY15_14225 [Pedobacter sp. MC2016-15]|uniref:hypothetical protein n=1 Tax=Pedobacter sp. MC2016-15 TaxID=2994473 RepID=UPI002246A1ED|nr:hypothetical protein [Pedobacter sp. MC2016-15]MCX2480253.1 hypothetical protein [Pedobacter sp. MC2016-15]